MFYIRHKTYVFTKSNKIVHPKVKIMRYFLVLIISKCMKLLNIKTKKKDIKRCNIIRFQITHKSGKTKSFYIKLIKNMIFSFSKKQSKQRK